MSRKGLAALLVAAAAALAASGARADEKIRIMIGGYEKQIYLPAKLAESLGYYKDEGLDVEILNEASGVNAENELLAGSVQATVGFYDHCIDLQAKGKYVQSVVQFSRAPGEVELVSSKHPQVKSMADLKGQNLGVTGLGSSTNFLTKFLMKKAGVADGDYTTVPVGAGTTFIAAIQQDKIQAGMTTEPTITRLLKTNEARILIDMRDVEKTKAALGGTYPAASLYMDSKWVAAHKPTVQKLANALVKALKFIDTHTGAEITEKMPQSFWAADKEGYIKALDDGKKMFTPDGVMPEDGPPTVLAVLAAFSKNLQGKTIDLSKTYTTEFVKAAK